MGTQDKSKEELISELQKLRQENNVLKALCDKDNSEHKQAEKALRESEARFRHLLQSVPSVAVQGYGPDGTTRYWNEASEHLYGYTAQEALGRNLIDLIIPPEMRGEVKQLIQQMAETGQQIPASEVSLMRKDGSRVYVFSSHATVQMPGQAPELFCIDIDITERKQAEADLRIKNQVFEDAIATQSIADKNGVITHVNPAFLRLWGYVTKEQAIGNSVGSFFADPDDAKPVLEVLAAHDAWQGEFRAKRVDGTTFLSRGLATSLRNAQGEPVGYQSTNLDITNERQAEEALRESEKKYRLLAEGMADVVWILDIETMHFSYVSQSVEKLRGYTPEEVMAQPVKDSVTPDSYKRVNDLMKIRLPHFLAQAEKKLSYVDEIDQPHKNGSIVHTEVTTSYLLNEDGKLEVVGISRDITERKRAEDALKESALDLEKRNNYITTILENLAIGFSVHFIDSGVTEYINPAYSRVYGWPAEDMKDVESFFKLIYPDPVYSAQQMKMVMEDINSGDPERMHWEGFMITTKTGEERFIEARNIPLPDQNLMISTAWDITERKRADELLQTNYKRLDLAMQTANMAWWEMDIASGNVTFNPRKTEMLGYTPEKFNHYKDFMALVHPEDSDKAMNAMRKHLDGTVENYEVAYRILNNSGEYKWFYDIGSIVKKDSEGKPLKVTGLVIDITERKLAEDLLTESELKYRSLIENSSDAIFCIDEKGQYQFVNHHFSSIFGKTPEYFNGKTIWDLYDKEFADKRFELTKRLFKFGISESLEVELPLPDKTLYFWATTNPIRDKTGKVVLNLTHATDITELKNIQNDLIKAKEKAEESDRLKTAFLNNISHEIRTPLNAICGFSSFLNDDNLTNKERNHYVEIIQDSSNQLLHIVTDIISISALETRQVSLNISNLIINNLISELYTIFELRSKKNNILLQTHKPLTDIQSEILTDKAKITQILTNLLENALKFTKQGAIEFGYELKENELIFFVKDSGIGIKPEVHQKIFDRFIQADKTIQTNYGGTGLGLSISKGFVELLGGKIWVQSEPEKGSTFYFTIPYKPVTKIDLITTNLKSKISDEITILVAEDEMLNFSFIELLLKKLNLKVIHAHNGQEAVDICKANPNISLILMDIKMPKMDGHTAAKIIKELKPEIPIIAQSAYAMEHEQSKYEGIFDDYLPKPFSQENLKQKVMKYFIRQ